MPNFWIRKEPRLRIFVQLKGKLPKILTFSIYSKRLIENLKETDGYV